MYFTTLRRNSEYATQAVMSSIPKLRKVVSIQVKIRVMVLHLQHWGKSWTYSSLASIIMSELQCAFKQERST